MMDLSVEKTNRFSRILELDVFRGWAALSVVLAHLCPDVLEGDRICNGILSGFDAGLAFRLFFIISGYVILMTIRRCEDPFAFVVSRAARLLPVYLVSVLIMYGLRVMEHPEDFTFIRFPWFEVMANLAMVPEFLGVPLVTGVIWTLQVELVFYVFMVFVHSLGLIQWMDRICFSIVALALLIQAEWGSGVFPQAWMQQFILYAPFFVIGVLFRSFREEGISRFRVVGLILAIGGAVWAEQTQYVLVGTGVFFLMEMGLLTVLCVKPLIWLGSISYALYLIHNDLGLWIQRGLMERIGSGWASFLISLGAVVGIAQLMTYWVDRPMGRWVKKEMTRERLIRMVWVCCFGVVYGMLLNRGSLFLEARAEETLRSGAVEAAQSVELESGSCYWWEVALSGEAPAWVYFESSDGWKGKRFKVEKGISQKIQVRFRSNYTGRAVMRLVSEGGDASKIEISKLTKLPSYEMLIRAGRRVLHGVLLLFGGMCVVVGLLGNRREKLLRWAASRIQNEKILT